MLWLIIIVFSAIMTGLLNYFWLVSIPFIILEFIGFMLLGVILYVLFACLCAAIIGHKEKNKNVVNPPKILSYITLWACQFITNVLRVKVIIKGKEKFDINKRYLLVSNHKSLLDPVFFIKGFSKMHFTFLMKQELMKVIVLKTYLPVAGFYPVNRDNNREGLKTILTTIEAAKVRNVAAFPEGTRSKTSELLEFRDGIFKVAQKAKCDVAVCSISNTNKIKSRFPFRRTKVVIELCDIISYDDVSKMTTIEIGEMSKELISKSIKKNREEYKFLNEK